MKKSDLINAAKDLNVILGLDPPIDIENSTSKEIRILVKEASLWLLVADSPNEVTIGVLKELPWEETDFTNLEKDQNPLPLFRMHEIWMGGDGLPDEDTSEEVEPEPVPEPLPTDIVDIEEVPEELPEEAVKKATIKEKKVPAKAKVPGERGTYRSSAYSTAISIMGTEPTLTLQDLHAKVSEAGFADISHGNSVKTAHSIFRKVYKELSTNGFIK